MEEWKTQPKSPCLGPLRANVLRSQKAWFVWSLHDGIWKALSGWGLVKLLSDAIWKTKLKHWKRFLKRPLLWKLRQIHRMQKIWKIQLPSKPNVFIFNLSIHLFFCFLKNYFTGLSLRLLGPAISQMQILTWQKVGTLYSLLTLPYTEWMEGYFQLTDLPQMSQYHQGPDPDLPPVDSH